MILPRIVARLDIKRDRVVKGISMQGERSVGDPHDLALRYYRDGADELLFVDTYASLIGRNVLATTIARVSDEAFIPLVVAGGIRTHDDVRACLRAGADRVGLNTRAVRDPRFLRDVAASYGASTIALLVDVTTYSQGYEVLVEYGREPTGIDAVSWISEAAPYVGEVIVTSIEKDGRVEGPDLGLIAALGDLAIDCPLTYGGGIRGANDIETCLIAGIDAVAIGAALHFSKTTMTEIKQELVSLGRRIRV